MKRLPQSLILLILAVPAFTGLFLVQGPTLFLDIQAGRLLYWLATALAITLLRGRFLWLAATIIAFIIAIPVAGGGALLSLLLHILGLSAMTPNQIAAHYVFLFINMLSMIPLAIALVSLIPTAAMEAYLLRSVTGVNTLQKILLMALRVFNHVVFAVMPEILQAVTEELRFNSYIYKTGTKIKYRRWLFLRSILQKFMFVAVASLCLSVKYIHFWTAEISALPGKSAKSIKIATTAKKNKHGGALK